ncbi:hypothetical protein Tco_0748159 [Tanacetum coccineum]|uniref:Uncharacterized protein n=1 Tax=Tanacetum coccineum TaxID=301880 RepID=A0ABQ4YXU0_9ASTR
MRDENPILTLRDYSKPSHESYKNTIELPVGNNVAKEQCKEKDEMGTAEEVKELFEDEESEKETKEEVEEVVGDETEEEEDDDTK